MAKPKIKLLYAKDIPMSRLKDIKELSTDELVAWLSKHAIKPYRAAQIEKWIYMRQVDSFSEMTDLTKDLRNLLSENFAIHRLAVENERRSSDGSRKFLFELEDGNLIESVLIPGKDHYTLCVSSQAGCAQGCRFCCTARGGFVRNLTRGEIVAQVRDSIHLVDSDSEDPLRLTNLVFMGMGEPLANYENLMGALEAIMENENGLGFSSRRVTVSTAGLVPKIAAFGRDSAANIAVSLNAADNETRSRLMPVNRKYPVEELVEACKQYPLKRRRRITFEYILIQGVNDSEADADRVAGLLRPVSAKINLIPFNEFEGSEFKRPDESVIARFRDILVERNYTVMVRQSKGADISAACGQLRARACRRADIGDGGTSA